MYVNVTYDFYIYISKEGKVGLANNELIKQFHSPVEILADLDVPHHVGVVVVLAAAWSTTTFDERRREVARLHGHGSHARRGGDLVPVRREQDRRPNSGEAGAHVPERRHPRRDELVGEAEQVDLRQRLLVVLQAPRVLPLLVRALEHLHRSAIDGGVLLGGIPRLEPLVVVGVQRRHEDCRGAIIIVHGKVAGSGDVDVGAGGSDFRQDVFLPGTREDLVVHVVHRNGGEEEHPDLHADDLVGVREVEPGDHLPHGVGRVEEVPRQEMRHALHGREHPPELGAEGREHRRHEVEVAVQQQPRHVPEQALVVPAAEEGRVHDPTVVPDAQVRVRRRRRGRRVIIREDDGFGFEEVGVGVVRVSVGPEVEEVGEGEFRRDKPRGVRERLAEEVGGVVGERDEEDAVGEQRVEEAAEDGEHPVAEAVEGEPEDVAAIIVVVPSSMIAIGAETLDGLGVERRAGAAPLVASLVGA
ncbi:hypothetical protein PR202_gb12087 [Eleusine coracana subsp. coracana]|uniref:Uncharacterized protein n=1 Tax=Eleusine coracana subsp. coracana TaxID=191504 RepID=A0AAV5ENV3_ELECO|nr:hypothetical protein PR202_gb12087 [Eleusine coracana subsp. coracana]